jgi:adenine-specific DNA-methyltransferase
MQNLYEDLAKILEKDERVFADDKILKNKISELAFKMDKNLLDLLLKNKQMKDHFFIEINKVLVFNQDKFIKFINNKEFLPDSFTTFKNRIGLTENDDYIKDNGKVVLAWSYKDCVLEGGQDKEDAKRDEIFYNEILAPDEIDRLFEPKVLTNFKRFDKFGGHKIDSIKEQDNLIVKGNNLLALYSLRKRYAGKIKLIYIDPPYNTGNDEFRYNDSFNHSTWLTFMKNRLNIAKELLSDDGAIFIQCDDNEQAYLKVLMDETFSSRRNFINCIAVKMNESKGLKNSHVDKRFPKNKEYILVYAKNPDSFTFTPKKVEKERDELEKYIRYYNKWIPNINEDISKWKIEEFPKDKLDLSSKLEFKDKLIYLVSPDNEIKVKIQKGRFVKIINKKGLENIYYNQNGEILNVLFLAKNINKFLGDLWTDISTININKEGGIKTLNNGQKPEKLIQRIIEVASKEGDIVLDYHLGSGTTCAVANKIKRRYIGIEQLNYGETDCVERLKNVLDGEQGGISKSVNWKGGGSFVYAELKQWNEEYMQKIHKAKTPKELADVYKKMQKESFFRYEIDLSKFDEKDFTKLDLKNQKQVLMGCLDKNHLYVNYSEIEDSTYKVSAEDKKINKQFYGK